jgi:hypothetical protein
MATVTERWEVEELAECLRCGDATTVAPVARGVVVAGGILCDDCRFHLIHIGEWGEYLARLRLAPTRPEGPDGDGDGDDDPPAAPAVRPGTLWLIVNGQSVPRELSPAEEEELVEFSEACRASAPDVEPCVACNRPASPYVETPDGLLCFRCWPEPPTPTPGRPDRADLAAAWVDTLTELQAAYAALGRIDALLERIRQGASTGRI